MAPRHHRCHSLSFISAVLALGAYSGSGSAAPMPPGALSALGASSAGAAAAAAGGKDDGQGGRGIKLPQQEAGLLPAGVGAQYFYWLTPARNGNNAAPLLICASLGLSCVLLSVLPAEDLRPARAADFRAGLPLGRAQWWPGSFEHHWPVQGARTVHDQRRAGAGGCHGRPRAQLEPCGAPGCSRCSALDWLVPGWPQRSFTWCSSTSQLVPASPSPPRTRATPTTRLTSASDSSPSCSACASFPAPRAAGAPAAADAAAVDRRPGLTCHTRARCAWGTQELLWQVPGLPQERAVAHGRVVRGRSRLIAKHSGCWALRPETETYSETITSVCVSGTRASTYRRLPTPSSRNGCTSRRPEPCSCRSGA